MHAVNQAVGTVIEVGLQVDAIEFIGTITGNHHGRLIITNAVTHHHGAAAHGTQGVIPLGIVALDRLMALTRGDIVNQLACHRNLELRFLTERDTYRVAKTLGHQRTYTHRTLDTAILAKSRLGHAQVQREMHILAVHGIDQTAHRLDHDHDIRRLHRNHHVHEFFLDKHPQEFHHALDHACRSVAIAAHDAVAQRAVVYAQAQCGVVLTAHGEQWQ